MNKKNIIKIVSIVLATVILAVGLYFLITKVFLRPNYSVPTIVVESVKGKEGKTIKVPVKVYKNPGVMGYILRFDYDNTVLTYAGYEKGNILSDYLFEDYNGMLIFANAENEDIKKDGTLFYLKFKIKETDKKTANINLTLTGQDAGNSDLQPVVFQGVNGTVKIR